MGEEKILVAGHLSLDRIKTPDREENQVPGGAALYTSVAASVYGGTTGLLTTCCSDFPGKYCSGLKVWGLMCLRYFRCLVSSGEASWNIRNSLKG